MSTEHISLILSCPDRNSFSINVSNSKKLSISNSKLSANISRSFLKLFKQARLMILQGKTMLQNSASAQSPIQGSFSSWLVVATQTNILLELAILLAPHHSNSLSPSGQSFLRLSSQHFCDFGSNQLHFSRRPNYMF